ncbi:MAG: (Fe-S)-binding protein, partial [Armatimonadetes bacterium]|nr:(Fe-S)-binding protein [Armatimonadota bacterium]
MPRDEAKGADALPPPEVAEELLRCNRCGFCLNNCPTYRVTNNERFVARGRNYLAGEVWDGTLPLGPEEAEPLFQCLLCGACTVTCRSGVQTDEVMVHTRHLVWQEKGRPAGLRLFFDRLLPNPRLLRRVVQLVGLGKRSGLSSLARRLGLLRWINARLEGAEGLVETMPRTFLRDRLKAMGFERHEEGGQPYWLWPRPKGSSGPRLLYFIGCGTNFQLPDTGEAAMRVLHAGGCELVVVEHVCCGLPPWAYGDLEASRRLAQTNVERLGALEADFIVSECGSCTSFLRKYGELLGEAGEAVSDKIRDFTQVALELDLPRLTEPLRVTYHDPCHLVRGQGITEEPRELLRRAGCDLVEMKEADWCCGGAGTYNIMQPELSLRILERKMRNIEATGAPVVATACPSC